MQARHAGPQPAEEIADSTGSEEVSDEEDAEDDLVGALDDILEDVQGGGGDDDEENRDSEAGADPDDDVVADEGQTEGDHDSEEIGDTTDSTDPGDNYAPPPGPAAPLSTARTTSTTRWALHRVSGTNFTDEQAAALREQLEDGSYSHVLIVKTSPGSTGYTALQRACDMLMELGYPMQFHGRLLLAGKAVTYANIACRDEGLEDPVEMVQHVLGAGIGVMEEIPVSGEDG